MKIREAAKKYFEEELSGEPLCQDSVIDWLTDFAFQVFGIKKLDYNDANEAYAYLVGWAANSIYK